MPIASAELSLRDLLTTAFRFKGRMVGVALAVMAVVTVGTLLWPAEYQARSEVLVRFGREYVYRPEVGEQRPLIQLTPEEVLNSEVQILTSNELVGKVIETIGPDLMYPSMLELSAGTVSKLDAARRRFEKGLAVAAVRKSSVIQVAFTHRDAQIAAQVVNLLVALYQEKHLEVFGDRTNEFLEAQLKEYETALQGAEAALAAFKQEHGVFAYDEQLDLLLKRRADLETAQRDAEIRRGELGARAARLQRRLREFSTSPDYRPLANPVYADADREFFAVQAQASGEASRIRDVKQLLVEVNDRLKSLDRAQQELAEIKRSLADAEKNYQLYRTKAEEVRVASGLDQRKLGNVSVIERAEVPTRPIRPQVGLNLLVGLFLSILSGVLYAVLAHQLGQGISAPDAAERLLEVPILVTVAYRPEIDGRLLPALAESHRAIDAGADGGVTPAAAAHDLGNGAGSEGKANGAADANDANDANGAGGVSGAGAATTESAASGPAAAGPGGANGMR